MPPPRNNSGQSKKVAITGDWAGAVETSATHQNF
jgi:hypothetical protein